MTSKYWIKLYHEILDDPKMGRLPDRLWRRVLELFLLAGELDLAGYLSPPGDMAWRLRLTDEALEADLLELQKVGIVQQRDGRWFVTNFAKRQEPVDGAERQKRYRQRQRQTRYAGDKRMTPPAQTGDDGVTPPGEMCDAGVTHRNAPGDAGVTGRHIDADTEADTESSSAATRTPDDNPFVAWEGAAGMLSQIIADDLGDLVDECEAHRQGLPRGSPGADLSGGAWVCTAIREMIAAGVTRPNTRYLTAILDRWQREGYQSDNRPSKPSGNGRKGKAAKGLEASLDAVQEILEEESEHGEPD